jgi:hypothetical protein
MRIEKVIYSCDNCEVVTEDRKMIVPYTVTWEGIHKQGKVTIERWYCLACHSDLQKTLVKQHKIEVSQLKV